jgi:hypothetical protein
MRLKNVWISFTIVFECNENVKTSLTISSSNSFVDQRD